MAMSHSTVAVLLLSVAMCNRDGTAKTEDWCNNGQQKMMREKERERNKKTETKTDTKTERRERERERERETER